MSYSAASFSGFGAGLNLKSQPDVLREDQAVDLLNVTFSVADAVEQRDGYGKLTTSEGTNRYDSLHPHYEIDGTKQLIAGAGNRLDVIDAAGAVVSSSTAPTASPHYFARFGAPSGERTYIANGTDTVRYWDGATFTTPAYTGTTITGRYLAVQAADNRLVNARFSGTTAGSNPSSVRFSDEGNPHEFDANNYVDLTPGDGEQIMGVAAWRELVFVFKESKFFVFYGTSVGADGNPEFNYRPVDAGVGLAASRGLAVGNDGVYFLSRRGVHRTTGAEPQLLSGIVDPIFLGGASDFYSGGNLTHGQITNCALTVHEERVYVAFPAIATTNDRMLVYDPQSEWWSLWNIPAAALCPFRVGDQEELVFAYAAGQKHIGRHSSAYTNDDAAAITSYWQSGWFDYGDPTVKTIRESKVWGRGRVQVAVAKDFSFPTGYTSVNFDSGLDLFEGGANAADLFADGTNANDTFAVASAASPKLIRKAVRGTTFSVRFKNETLNQSWRINRFANHLRETRQPTTVKVR